jgi:succinate-semialdehyde dehydrogenase / glutarate-semialdehyde dehydrogenase
VTDLNERAQRVITDLRAGEGIHIAGTWQKGANGTFVVDDPATGTAIADVADGGAADATRAVDAAAAAQPAWAALAPRTRSELLGRVRELMLRDVEDLAALIALENGKSLADARGEVVYAAEFFRWFAEEAVRPGGDFGESPAGGTRTIVTHRPVGVAALITPWNFPAAMATRKIAPALAAGCTVVLKPASETPLTALAITRLLGEAGVPDGVVNVVPAMDAATIATTWLEDPRVRKISFTGSTNVGRILLRQAADRVVNASMELGGNAPFIVTADADIDAAVEGAMIAKFRNGGQACTAANRFYVHADVVDAFTAAFGAKVEALAVGPAADGSEIGPLISQRALANVTRLVDEAVAAGARIASAAAPATAAGHFFTPVVLADVPADAAVVVEEIFGPVAPIVTWEETDDLVSLVNASEFGLAGYVYAGDLGAGLRLAERLEIGMVGINRGLVSDPAAPFGGTKQSGLGREGAREGLAEFQETQYFSVAW